MSKRRPTEGRTPALSRIGVLERPLGDGVRAVFTTRYGGVSSPPWEFSNLSMVSPDERARTLTNLEMLRAMLGAGKVHFPQQVHGPDVLVVDERRAGRSRITLGGAAGVDALVTRLPGIPLGVRAADCMPVLFADPANRVVGAAHAGRRGLAGGVLQNTVAAMVGLGAEPARINAVIGPAVCGRCYEVPGEMREEVAAVVPGAACETRHGTPSLDLPKGAVNVLRAARLGRVKSLGICTVEDDRFYSYRQAAQTSRFAGVVMLETDAEQPTAERIAELRANLAEVEERVAAACRAAGRARTELTLVAITKTFPAADVRGLAEIGLTDVGENRDQEAAPKHAACADLDLRWHFVGQLQRNKARSVARYADVVHSIDRPELVDALSRAAQAAGRTVTGLVQVDLNPAASSGRAGAAQADVAALADQVALAPGLVLGGVMAVAPLGAEAGPAFARLAIVAEQVRAAHPQAQVVSAGMSGDLEFAVENGATHLRIGTALLGRRSVPLG